MAPRDQTFLRDGAAGPLPAHAASRVATKARSSGACGRLRIAIFVWCLAGRPEVRRVPFSSSCVAVVGVDYRRPRCFYARDGSALDLGALRSAQEHPGARPTSPWYAPVSRSSCSELANALQVHQDDQALVLGALHVIAGSGAEIQGYARGDRTAARRDPGAGFGEIRSHSHFPTKFSRRFPPKSHMFQLGGSLQARSAQVRRSHDLHHEGEASRFR